MNRVQRKYRGLYDYKTYRIRTRGRGIYLGIQFHCSTDPLFNGDSQYNEDMPPLLNDDSQNNEEERHSSQMYVDKQHEPQVIRTLELQRTMQLALSIQSGHGLQDQNFCVHQPRTDDTGVHDQRPSSQYYYHTDKNYQPQNGCDMACKWT